MLASPAHKTPQQHRPEPRGHRPEPREPDSPEPPRLEGDVVGQPQIRGRRCWPVQRTKPPNNTALNRRDAALNRGDAALDRGATALNRPNPDPQLLDFGSFGISQLRKASGLRLWV
jgi:hypothetical protein